MFGLPMFFGSHFENLPPRQKMKKSEKFPSSQPEELSAIFHELKKIISNYENPLRTKNDTKTRYDLWSFKDITIENRKRKEVYFAGIVQQKSYVGFYYMPIYADTTLKEVFQPELLSLLKGKSCFHIKKLTPEIKNQINDSLKVGFEFYKKRNWI